MIAVNIKQKLGELSVRRPSDTPNDEMEKLTPRD
jgi:hypothetical protein